MSQFAAPISLEISTTSLNEGEQAIRQEFALKLYAQGVFTFGQARRLTDLSVWNFQQLLAEHRIPRHYDETELAQDIDTIQQGQWSS